MVRLATKRIRTSIGLALLFVAIMVCQPVRAAAQSAKITTMATTSVKEIAEQRRKDIAETIKLHSLYFLTASAEFADWCASLNAGKECTKWPSLRAQGILHHFKRLFESLPAAPQARLKKLVETKASIATLKAQYFQELKSFLKSYIAMTLDLNRIFEPLFLNYGVFVPENAASKELQSLLKKYKYAGVEIKDLDDTVQLLISLKLKQLMTVMYYSSPVDRQGLVMSNAAIDKITRDLATKEILSNAHAFFKSEQGGLFADAALEHEALKRVYGRLANKAPLSNGIWTSDKSKGKIENLPGTIELAKQGKVLNAHVIVKLWESAKAFNSEFLGRILIDNKDSDLQQLAENPDLLRIANPSDIGRSIDLIFFQPLATALQQDIFQSAYYKYYLSEMKDPRVEYQYRDFLKESKERYTKNNQAIDKLQRQFPGIVDRKRFDETVPKQREKGILQAKADIKAAKDNASEPSGVSQIAQGVRSLWQWVRNDVDYRTGVVVDAAKKQNAGTYADVRVAKRHEQMLRMYGYSAFGTDVDFLKGSKLKIALYQSVIAPVLSVSGMIGGSMVLLEDTWDLGIQEAYGMTPEQYNKAEKTDAGIKALKVSFYLIQGVAGLAVTVGTGGVAAPALVTRSAVAGLTIRTAASILIKPVIRTGVVVARKSIQPLATAFGLGAIFSVSQAVYESERTGEAINWWRVAGDSGRGASTTLMFMGGMSTLARRMAYMNFSQSAIAKTSATIDVLESSGDIPQTYNMWKEAKTPLQIIASLGMAIGNVLDSGDSAWTIMRGQKAEHARDQVGSEHSLGQQSFEEMASLRVEKAISALGEALTSRQASVIRNFLPGTGQEMLEAKLLKAKMPPQKAKKVASLFGLWKSQVAQP